MTEAPTDPFWQRLLHRWLVEYNPLYLFSAALVLAGASLISRGAVHAGSVYGQLGVTLIAEAYAWALILGAALLVRIELRRPAVMLGLLTVLYQGDLTLHTETCAYLGWVGATAALAWLASFVIKLRALAWALRLRPSRAGVAIPTLGAAGMTLFPRYLAHGDSRAGSVLVALWLFGVLAAGLWSRRRIESAVRLDAWGETVLRRSLRATWTVWLLLLLAHVAFWCSEYSLDPRVLLAVLPVLAAHWARTELGTWSVVSLALVFAGYATPAHFSLSALVAAGVLVLWALRRPTRLVAPARAVVQGPYRSPDAGEPPVVPAVASVGFERAGRDAMLRLFAGAAFGVYLSIWTRDWSGGPWPEHVVLLDLALTSLLLAVAWKGRVKSPMVLAVATYLHWAVRAQLLTAPTSVVGWGATAVSLGFVLLAGCLLSSWWLQRTGQLGSRAGSDGMAQP